MARFRARRVNQQRGMMWRDDGMVLLLLWWWCGRPVGNARLGEGVWAKNAKPSCHRSVSGAPCESAAGDDAEGWWDGVVVVVVVVVWPSGWKHEAQGGGLGQKRETELS